jgi:hypothetical protein
VSEPTAGATRAAMELFGDTSWSRDDALCIDRETGLPDILRLLRHAVEARSTLEMPSDEWILAARAALRKAGAL